MSTATTPAEVGHQLVDLCRQGKNLDAINTLYADDIVSVEVCGSPEMPAVMEGKQAVIAKGQWWLDNHEVHSADCKGPFPNAHDQFAVFFNYDVTAKFMNNQRMKLEEVGLYTVKDGKIVKEEFFYEMPGGE